MPKKRPPRIDWSRTYVFSVGKAQEGGPGAPLCIMELGAAGIPARRAYSPYVGQVGVEVPWAHRKRAARILRM